MEKEKIDIAILQWGPCVVKLKVKDEIKKMLLEEGQDTTNIDFRSKLAGILDHEKGYSDAVRSKFVPYLSQYLGVYDQAYQTYTNKAYDKKPEYILTTLWINYQKQHEFNPPHDHDGKLSFVIYLSIPDELKKENQAYQGKSCGPGGIQFVYGDGPRDCISYQSYFPEEGDMFIFPAWLKHWVSPFKSDCTRISVSGNIHDSAPLNTIQKVASEYIKDRDGEKRI